MWRPDRHQAFALLVLGLGLGSGAMAMPLAQPVPGRYACVAGAQSWFESSMAPAEQLVVLPKGAGFQLGDGAGAGPHGRIEHQTWTDQGHAKFDDLFERGAAVALFSGDARQPMLVGIYGERDGARTWLLRSKAGGGPAFVRCSDKPTSKSAPAATSSSEGRQGGGVLAAPPVRLPSGARLGGEFETGRYSCNVGWNSYAKKPFIFEYEFYPNGEWRRPGVPAIDGGTGTYKTSAQTGRFMSYIDYLYTDKSEPDDAYAVFYRTSSGASRLYARRPRAMSVDETQCERTGPAREPSPAEVAAREAENKAAAAARRKAEIAELSARNLRPPPPGATRWQGLYAKDTFHQDQTLDPGPYGGSARLVLNAWSTWEFLDFQPNGYVYLGLRNPDQPCDRPTVDDSGDPLCTTYSVDGGRLRVGHDDRGPVSRGERGVLVGPKKESFRAVPPLTPQRLAGTYVTRSCHGSICTKFSAVFGADGTFALFGLSQATGVGAGAAGLPIPRSWVNTDQLQGRYRIEGQSLRVSYSSGESGVVSVFLYPPRDNTLSLGGREYLREGAGKERK